MLQTLNFFFKTFVLEFPPFPGPKYDLNLQTSKISGSVDFLFGKDFKFLRHAEINVTKITQKKKIICFKNMNSALFHCKPTPEGHFMTKYL